MSVYQFTYLIRALLLSYSISSTKGDGEGTSADLEQMIQLMESSALTWAKHMEYLILPQNKCNSTTLSACSRSNYNGCFSQLPYATCPGAENRILRCGDGSDGGCSGLFDFTSPMVSIAKGDFSSSLYSPPDRMKDGVCATMPGDEFIINVREEQAEYWSKFNVVSPTYYYGNEDGVFRILPGTPADCPTGQSEYDPRIRPWFVAASSGPKDIILVLDTSGSMGNYGRLRIMKEAATRVIETLGVGDFFSVITFNDKARSVGSNGRSIMQRAAAENKKKILEQIDEIGADGGTNFYSGFNLAFETFKESIKDEFTTSCHKAILFLTDGMNNDDTDTLKRMISSEMSQYAADDRPVIFTYSFGSGADKNVPKSIACENDGIWASIEDGGNLAESMGAYYKYFAYGLHGKENENFVAWVEPYIYSTNNELGTTASVPVYDRSVDPPIMAGVIGLDFSFPAMERALGEEGQLAKDAILKRIVELSAAKCPNLSLTACQLQSLREYGSGDHSNSEAMCPNVADENEESCDTNPLKSVLCNEIDQAQYYPSDIWNNDLNKGRTYEEKVCCTVGDQPRKPIERTDAEVEELVCFEGEGKAKSVSIGIVVGVVVGVVVLFVSFALWKVKKNRRKNIPITSRASAIDAHVEVLPPPTAPSY